MAIYNMQRPNTRPYANARPNPAAALSSASEMAKPGYSKPGYGSYTRPVQNEMGAKPMSAKIGSPPPQFAGPANSGFSGQIRPMRPPQSIAPPPQQIQPIGIRDQSMRIGSIGGGLPPAQSIQPIGSGVSAQLQFDPQRQYMADLANLGNMLGGFAPGSAPSGPNPVEQFMGGGQAPPGQVPFWLRRNQPPQAVGTLGAALEQYFSGGSPAVMNPTLSML